MEYSVLPESCSGPPAMPEGIDRNALTSVPTEWSRDPTRYYESSNRLQYACTTTGRYSN